MLGWNHSGFGVHDAVRLDADDLAGRERLSNHMLRCPFSLERLIRVTGQGMRSYRILYHLLARHVRLIAPEPWRLKAFAAATGVSRAEALKTVRRIDADRTHYVKAHFSHDPGDPLAYDLVLNMAHLDVGQASRAIAALLPAA